MKKLIYFTITGALIIGAFFVGRKTEGTIEKVENAMEVLTEINFYKMDDLEIYELVDIDGNYYTWEVALK